MKTIDPQFQDVIGNASDGTSMDYLKVCKIYGCETCHGKVDHYAYEKDMKRMKTPKLTFSLDGCKDNEGQEQCEQLLLGRQLNCAKDEDKARYSDPWRCEVQLAYQKMDCNEDTETASCCVTCSLYRNYMRSD
ncbi:unnamed protein product [Cylicocyclus nassatus]|uniref:Uncharacterized protein n=1 Tax=Cylicocyclus nassatus TaxID=53992 RepID=A0AA36GPI6_CYLNA|nr:unnamed protein product [Cylicocyclus nassatus]